MNLFSYGAPEGTKRQRKAGVTWLQKSGFYTDAEHIVPAAGGQNALTAALGALFESGGKVGTDPMTYPGVKTAAKLFGVHLVPIQCKNNEMTEEGIQFAVRNENIKGLYVIPDFHNPTSHIMSVKTRKMIAEAAQKNSLIIIEDGINNLLTEKPLPPIASFAPEHTVYISSLSKTVSAGLRTAFIHVPKRHKQDLTSALYSMNISLSPLLATTSAALIEDSIADEIIAERKKLITQRNLLVNKILDGYVTPSELTAPLRYLKLPEHFTGKSFEICAKQAGVEIYGAERFAVGNTPTEKSARISVTTPHTADDLAEGLKRLKRLLTI